MGCARRRLSAVRARAPVDDASAIAGGRDDRDGVLHRPRSARVRFSRASIYISRHRRQATDPALARALAGARASVWRTAPSCGAKGASRGTIRIPRRTSSIAKRSTHTRARSPTPHRNRARATKRRPRHAPTPPTAVSPRRYLGRLNKVRLEPASTTRVPRRAAPPPPNDDDAPPRDGEAHTSDDPRDGRLFTGPPVPWRGA